MQSVNCVWQSLGAFVTAWCSKAGDLSTVGKPEVTCCSSLLLPTCQPIAPCMVILVIHFLICEGCTPLCPPNPHLLASFRFAWLTLSPAPGTQEHSENITRQETACNSSQLCVLSSAHSPSQNLGFLLSLQRIRP